MALDDSQQPENSLGNSGPIATGVTAQGTQESPPIQDLQPLQDDLAKHQVFIQRLQGSQTQNIKDYLDQLKKTALQQIKSGSTINLNSKLRSAMQGLPQSAMESIADLAEYESKFSAKAFEKHIDGVKDLQPVDKQDLLKQLQTKNMDIGHNYKSGTNELVQTGTKRSLNVAYKQFANRKADEITQLIQDGYKGKLSDLDIARNVSSKIDGLHMAQARSLAKTSVNFGSLIGRLATINQNDQLDNQYIWNATLENSCSDCEENHGQVMDIGDDVPPLHYNCSCYISPVSPSNIPTKAPEVETTNNTFNQNLDITNGAGNDAED